MSADRAFGTEIQNTEDERLEEATVENAKSSNRGKRYKTGYNLFMQKNSVSLTKNMFSFCYFTVCVTGMIWMSFFLYCVCKKSHAGESLTLILFTILNI